MDFQINPLINLRTKSYWKFDGVHSSYLSHMRNASRGPSPFSSAAAAGKAVKVNFKGYDAASISIKC